MTRDEIVTAARAALNTPFVHQGRRVGKGLDCAGLLVHVATSLGVEMRDRDGYGRMPTNGELEAAIQDHVDHGIIAPVSVRDLQPGDLVLMRFERENAPRHLGIIGFDDTLIHAWAVAKKVCEHRIDRAWRSRIVGAWRFVGVTE
jgi:cell wall-associated NlpC family hydrolase